MESMGRKVRERRGKLEKEGGEKTRTNHAADQMAAASSSRKIQSHPQTNTLSSLTE